MREDLSFVLWERSLRGGKRGGSPSVSPMLNQLLDKKLSYATLYSRV